MTAPALPSEDVVDRFATDLDRLVPVGERLGIAVSGGPDSLALLLLATAARPGLVEAVTVDHGLRPGSAEEAALVKGLCRQRRVPHDTLKADWPEGPPDRNIEAMARKMRYARIGHWARQRGLRFLATAHHADDQAETLLMRLARGSGLKGLSGIRETRALGGDVTLVRPLLEWQKPLLLALVLKAHLPFLDDPMNKDGRFDRVRVRDALRDSGFLDARHYVRSARALAEAEDALRWTVNWLAASHLKQTGKGWALAHDDLPPELLRRLLLAGLERMGDRAPRGPDLSRAMVTLAAGGQCVLGHTLLKAEGDLWSLSPAPPRRD